jgi:ABC-type nitrate/sulfonate/bicarbonate transport system substrate-binding protein
MAQALAALKAGSIDAMLTVDGFPVERLALGVSSADGSASDPDHP